MVEKIPEFFVSQNILSKFARFFRGSGLMFYGKAQEIMSNN